MTERDEWERYPSGRSETVEEARQAAFEKAERAARAFRLPYEKLKFQMTRFGARIFWRIIPKQ